MESGSIVSKWMLEFAIFHLKDDNLIAKMLTDMPILEDDVGMKKIILLRAIESEVAENSVSEKTLDVLEISYELDQKAGFEVLESMKTAYCSVAIDCVARFAKNADEGDEYFDAVKRIWRKRIGRLRGCNVDLFSKHLEIWMDTIESAVWDSTMRQKFVDRNTRLEAVVAVKRFLVEAWKTVRPKLTLSALSKRVVEAQLLTIKSINIPQEFDNSSIPTAQCEGDFLIGPNDPSTLVSGSLLNKNEQEQLVNRLSQNQNNSIDNSIGIIPGLKATVNVHQNDDLDLADAGIAEEQNLLRTSNDLIIGQFENIEHIHDKGGGNNDLNDHVVDLPSSPSHRNLQSPNNLEAHCEVAHKVRLRGNLVASPIKLSTQVQISDSKDAVLEISNKHNISLSEVEVIKTLDELKSSSRALHNVVKDPLADALHIAEALLSDLSGNFVPQTAPSIHDVDSLKSRDAELEKVNDEDSTYYEKNVQTSSMEGNPAVLKTNQAYDTEHVDAANNESYPIAVCDGRNNLQNEGSGQENPQLRPNLWERNAGTYTYEWDDSVDESPAENFRLPTPKSGVNSPLRRYESMKFARRRRIKKWSVQEEDTLREGVQRYGRGNWKIILNAYLQIFEGRTEVDLKDKWRRMIS